MELTEIIQGHEPSIREKIGVTWKMGVPAMLSQLSSMAMQYIDAAMVGSLGAAASASVGLVSSSLWLVNGFTFATVYGFTVQIAYELGAGRKQDAKRIFRQGIRFNLIFAAILSVLCALVSFRLPYWLGATPEIAPDAGIYFRVFGLSMMWVTMHRLAAAALQAAGKMRSTAVMESLLCLFDVIYNALLIFPSGTKHFLGLSFWLPGANLGVLGATIGSSLAELTAMVPLLYLALRKTDSLSYDRNLKAPFTKPVLKKALKIGGPYCIERTVICVAQIAVTMIVASLGTIAVAANSFAVIAESFCYMPGFGLAAAASPLVGQSLGAGNKKLARSFAWISVFMGMIVMGLTALIMYFVCPVVFAFFTPVAEVRALGVQVLRIQLFAEPFFGAAIVGTGALRGAGDTVMPSVFALVSMWGIRITLCLLLVGSYGLVGVWVAMAIELTARGIAFLFRLKVVHWEDKMDGKSGKTAASAE